jgi:ATP-binding cassette subfamily B protein
MPIYTIGIASLAWSNQYFKSKNQSDSKKILLKETNALAGSTTESLRNIELVKSLGLTNRKLTGSIITRTKF